MKHESFTTWFRSNIRRSVLWRHRSSQDYDLQEWWNLWRHFYRLLHESYLTVFLSELV